MGAGTGAGAIAVNELLDIDQIECFEREDAMQKMGKKIFDNYDNICYCNAV